MKHPQGKLYNPCLLAVKASSPQLESRCGFRLTVCHFEPFEEAGRAGLVCGGLGCGCGIIEVLLDCLLNLCSQEAPSS